MYWMYIEDNGGSITKINYAAMLFVASLDVLLYFGIIILIDKPVDNALTLKYEPLYFTLYISGILTIGWLRNYSMCKGGKFELIKREVENEPQKLKWSILSILYIIFVVVFFYFAVTLGSLNYNLLLENKAQLYE